LGEFVVAVRALQSHVREIEKMKLGIAGFMGLVALDAICSQLAVVHREFVEAGP